MSYLKANYFDKKFNFKFFVVLWGLLFVLFICASTPARAEIKFEEATQTAGMTHAGQSFGASWGDLNNDGWPDLWVGNHDSKPSLYLNKQDGSFADVIDEVWSANPRADTHGAAWADFDNDGDQDLVELVGATENEDGTFCFGCGRNHLFINDNGSLIESAEQLGLNSQGFGRSPLWFDADRDGKLDLLVVNTRQKWAKGLRSSTVFHQKENAFKKYNKEFGFRDERWSRRDKYLGLARNILRFKFEETGLINTHKHHELAQLANLNDDHNLEIILFSSPTRAYSISEIPFAEITDSVGFPGLDSISDVAIADFNGDKKSDMYLTLGPHLSSDVIQVSPSEIKGSLAGHKGAEPRTITFRAESNIEISIYPTFLSLSKVFIGSDGHHPDTRWFNLSPENPNVNGPVSADTVKNQGVYITYEPSKMLWTIRNNQKGGFIDFIIRSTKPISKIQTIGFEPFQEKGIDALLIREGNEYLRQSIPGKAGTHTSCHSVVAADFDNDMDIDLYLVCTGPVDNIPNRLLENDGKGNFQLVANAGGAAGSQLGRGDVAAVADYDRDGFLDIFITNGYDPTSPFVKDGPHQLFHNSGNDNHWLEIDLQGVKSNRDGIGAQVLLETNGVIQISEQRGGMHRITQNHKRIHFGLGPNTKADQLTINWPSGTTQILKNVHADQVLIVREKNSNE